MSYGWSSGSSFGQGRTFYFVPAIGVRVFPAQLNHGVLADFEWIDFGFNTTGTPNFAIGHLGYAYRFLISPRTTHRWLLTPHASVALGKQTRFPDRSFTVGGRVGVDLDLHFTKRFFVGWSLRFQALYPTKGQSKVFQYVSWNALPLRVGFDLGKTTPFEAAHQSAGRPKRSRDALPPAGVSEDDWEKEVQLAHSGRVRLGVGLPMALAGVAGIAVGVKADCYQPNDRAVGALVSGIAFTSIGAGISTAGIVSLVQASKDARKAPKSKRQRRGLIVGATLSSFLSAVVMTTVSLGSVVGCSSS
jgi:hypothetical protein